MALVFDTTNKRIILDVASITATEIYSRWVDWLAVGDNIKYLPAFRTTGGDDLGGGISIPAYYFLQNGWRVRPMESNHTLTITGNLFVDGGGDPVVSTLGNFNVLVKTVVPVQAQTVATSGSGVGTVEQVASAVWGATISGYTTLGTAGYELNGQKQFQSDISTHIGSITPASSTLHIGASGFHLTVGQVITGTYSDTRTYDAGEHHINDVGGSVDFYYDFAVGINTTPSNFNFVGHCADKHEIVYLQAYNYNSSQYETIGSISGLSTNNNLSFPLYTDHISGTGNVRIRFTGASVSDIQVHVDQIYVGYFNNVDSASIADSVRTELTPELTHLMQIPTSGSGSGLTTNQATMLLEMYELLGLDPAKPLIVTGTNRSAGSINQHIVTDTNSTVVQRV